MNLGFGETLLLIAIFSLACGPAISSFYTRWHRRAVKANAAAARAAAQRQAALRAEGNAVLRRFRLVAALLALAAAASLVYTLFLRPIQPQPQPYTAAVQNPAYAVQAQPDGTPALPAGAALAAVGDTLALEGWQQPLAVQMRQGWLYLAAQSASGQGSAILRIQPDGSGLAAVLQTEQQITAFAFAPDGALWYACMEDGRGSICTARSDDWGMAQQSVIAQLDGRPLANLSALAVGPDGCVYFAEGSATASRAGVLDALRAGLLAHTATGTVYAYHPATRAVTRVLTGVAWVGGLAVAPQGDTLYVSELAAQRVLAVPAGAQELAANSLGCTVLAEGLGFYPAGLAADDQGRLAVAALQPAWPWLEQHAGAPFWRGVALRLGTARRAALLPFAEAGDVAAVVLDAQGGLLAAVWPGQTALGGAYAVCFAPQPGAGVMAGLWLACPAGGAPLAQARA